MKRKYLQCSFFLACHVPKICRNTYENKESHSTTQSPHSVVCRDDDIYFSTNISFYHSSAFMQTTTAKVRLLFTFSVLDGFFLFISSFFYNFCLYFKKVLACFEICIYNKTGYLANVKINSIGKSNCSNCAQSNESIFYSLIKHSQYIHKYTVSYTWHLSL